MRLTVEIEGINLEKLLRIAQETGILLLGVRRTGARAMCVTIDAGDRRQLEMLCGRSGWIMRETRRDFTLRMVHFFQRRAALIGALLLCIGLVYASSQMILAVRIEHAQENEAEVRRFLKEEGIRPGRLKRAFSTDELRIRMAYHLPGLAFSSFRYAGSTLIVDCRPAVLGIPGGTPGSALDIVAAHPGIITRIWASSGTPLVVPGQAVHKGQVLIRGEERSEKGSVRQVRAQGEVLARMFASGQACASLNETRTVETGLQHTGVTLRTPWSTRVLKEAAPFDSCDESVEEQFIVGLFLPVWREKRTYAQTEMFREPRSCSDAASMAQGAAEKIAQKECPYDALILDKWVDYSMIDNEYLYAEVVLEYETSIAGRLRQGMQE